MGSDRFLFLVHLDRFAISSDQHHRVWKTNEEKVYLSLDLPSPVVEYK